MLYQFNEYEFNSKSLVLSLKGEPVAIRHNEAKLLCLLIEKSTEVLSKEDILSLVWQDKVVSEQAVFQNISHLRSLFGNGAIKTFPKRGYQWQLEVQQVIESQVPKNISIEDHDEAKHATNNVKAIKGKFNFIYSPLNLTVLLVTLVLLVTFIFQGSDRSATDEKTNIAYIPFKQGSEFTRLKFSSDAQDKTSFNFTPLDDYKRAHFLASAEQLYPELAKKFPLVLTAEIREFKGNYHLDFLLKGPAGDWQGQFFDKSQPAVIKKLLSHLELEVVHSLVNTVVSPEIRQAKLSIAHKESPNDLIVLGELVESYLSLGEFDKGLVMAEKLSNLAKVRNDYQQLGNSLLTQAQAYYKNGQKQLTAELLDEALVHFQKINDLRREANVWNSRSWIAHDDRDYALVKSSLLTSAEVALQAGDIEKELHALTYLSVLAHKHKQDKDKYTYLTQAENKMKHYNLPLYKYAKLPFHYAIYADNPSAKEPHLKQVLEYSALTPDHWIAQSSRLQLVQHYLAQGRINEAKIIVDGAKSDNLDNSYLKTIFAKASQDTHLFVKYAKKAFEQSQLIGNKKMSLDIALLLVSTPNTTANYGFYTGYIQENATDYWRKNNDVKLATLNL